MITMVLSLCVLLVVVIICRKSTETSQAKAIAREHQKPESK